MKFYLLILISIFSISAYTQDASKADTTSNPLSVGIKITPISYNQLSKYKFNAEPENYWVVDLYREIGSEVEQDPVNKDFFFMNSVEVYSHYKILKYLSAGILISYDNLYHQKFADARIMSLTPAIEMMAFYPVKQLKPFLSVNYGHSIVLNKTHEVRPYNITGKFFLGANAGTFYAVSEKHHVSFDASIEWRRFGFEDYVLYNEISMFFIMANLGYSYNF